MDSAFNVPVKSVLTLSGCVLVVFSLGHEYSFDSMNTYLMSYLRNRSLLTPDVAYADTLWIPSSNSIVCSFVTPVLVMLEQKIPPRLCILIGGWIFSLSVTITYFSIRYSFSTTILTYGVLNAVGKGVTYNVTTGVVIKTFKENRSIASGILAGSYVGIGFVWNLLVTHFINPNNIPPGNNVDSDRYFIDDAVLDRVPYCFLLLGGIYTVLFTVGVTLISSPESTSNTDEHEDNVIISQEDTPELSKGYSTFDSKDTSTEKGSQHSSILSKPLTPIEMLKTGRFYIMWIMLGSFGCSADMYFALFKPYAQTFIQDDHFLSLTASAGFCVSVIANLLWGFVTQRLGCKRSLPFVVGGFGLFLATVDATEYGGKPMVFVWVCMIQAFHTGILVVTPLIALEMFGSKYYSINYSLVKSAGIFTSLISVLITSKCKVIIGWHGIFLTSGCLVGLAFILSLLVYKEVWTRKSSTL